MNNVNKKARVLLLNPPTADKSNEVILSLAYLASSLRKHGHEVKVLDGTAPYKTMSEEDIKKVVLDFRPTFIGVTLTITYIAQTYRFLRDLRGLGVTIVAGGSHVNPLPEEAIANGVDLVALGEGENTIVELADYFVGNRNDLDNIRGLCIKKPDGSIYKTAPRSQIENLDEIPFPSFDDFLIRNYTGSDDVDSNPIFWAIFSSRGCPFNCTFCCGHNVFGRTYRLRSAQNIFDEIISLVDKYGVKKIAFQDDEILLSRKRIMELCNLLEKSNLKIKMSLRCRIDSVDVELLKKMQEVGFRRMSFGIESWNDITLKNINKRYAVKDILRGLDLLEKSGFPHVNFNTIIGFPWEDSTHMKKNLEMISSIPTSLRYFCIVVTPIPYPNTELYNSYHKEYGFTNWWLDPAMHWNGLSQNRPKPFFLYFARMITPLYVPDLYWKYSKKQKKDIENFCWQVFKMYIKRHLGYLEYVLVYILSRISYTLWRVSPGLENSIFRIVPERFLKENEKKISFTKAE